MSAQDSLARRLFVQACDLAPRERGEFLSAQAKVHPEAIEEVRVLLAFDGSTSPLDAPLLRAAELLDAADASVEESNKAPNFIGPYRILGEIAKGGMGTIFRAMQPGLDREVALKVPRPGLVDELRIRRFQHEAQVHGKLRHPGIAQVFAASSAQLDGEEQAYFAMELIDGVPLFDYVLEHRLPRDKRIKLFLQICDAVEHAHQNGVVHCDLKSANILVDQDGKAKVLDFGIAQVLNPEYAATTLGFPVDQLIGTLTHMAPEQIEGRENKIGPPADVYSLGVLLFELLCDAPPYELTGLSLTAATQRVLSGDVRSPRKLGVKLDRFLQAALFKALEVQPSRRYVSAGKLAQDLRAFCAAKPMVALPTNRLRGLFRFCKRHPALSSSLCAVLLVALASGMGFLYLRRNALQPQSAYRDSQGVLTILSESKKVLYQRDFYDLERIRAAEIRVRPKRLGGGKVLLLAMTNDCTDSELAGQLSFFDPENPEDGPYWTSQSLALNPPGISIDDKPEVAVNIGSLLVKDYFPELEGDEIAFFQQLDPYSPTCLRIIDLGGNLLYQVWHDGAINRLSHFPDLQRIIFCAVNSESNWESRGHPGKDTGYPVVIAALDLELGHVNEESWLAREGNILDSTVAWYRWFGPMESLKPLFRGWSYFGSPQGEWKETACLTWNPSFSYPAISKDYEVTISMAINHEGEVLGRWGSESFLRAENGSEDSSLEMFELLDYSELPVSR